MTFTMLSCQEKKEVVPTSAGRLSVRFVAKNGEANQPYTHYSNANVVFTLLSGGTRGPNSTGISITGKEDANNKFETNVFFQTKYNSLTSLPEYDYPGFYSAVCLVGGQPTIASISTGLEKLVTITKNDADSLGGTFRVKMEDLPRGSSTNYKEMDGYFCIAKKGVL